MLENLFFGSASELRTRTVLLDFTFLPGLTFIFIKLQ